MEKHFKNLRLENFMRMDVIEEVLTPLGSLKEAPAAKVNARVVVAWQDSDGPLCLPHFYADPNLPDNTIRLLAFKHYRVMEAMEVENANP